MIGYPWWQDVIRVFYTWYQWWQDKHLSVVRTHQWRESNAMSECTGTYLSKTLTIPFLHNERVYSNRVHVRMQFVHVMIHLWVYMWTHWTTERSHCMWNLISTRPSNSLDVCIVCENKHTKHHPFGLVISKPNGLLTWWLNTRQQLYRYTTTHLTISDSSRDMVKQHVFKR